MSDLTWRKAIEAVLDDAGGSMHYKDIADEIVSQGLRESVGATPAATVSANLTTSIAKFGDKSPFQKTGRGEYMLHSQAPKPQEAEAAAHVETAEKDDAEDQYEIISSFGMFWRRDFVDWNSSPQLLGMQQIGAEPVNFYEQVGIYLLYDSREIIYVGRSTNRPLGKRLYEHTADRLATRWDRFSWFGLLPVSDKGKLGTFPSNYIAKRIAPALEAILIEALEPRQNRKRGDDLSAVEYLQKEDPELSRKKQVALLEQLANKV